MSYEMSAYLRTIQDFENSIGLFPGSDVGINPKGDRFSCRAHFALHPATTHISSWALAMLKQLLIHLFDFGEYHVFERTIRLLLTNQQSWCTSQEKQMTGAGQCCKRNSELVVVTKERQLFCGDYIVFVDDR